MQAPGSWRRHDRADRLEDIRSEQELVDITGRLRSPAGHPRHWAGVRRQTRGCATRPIPRRSREIILVMRQAGQGPYADRTRGLIAILGRRVADQRSARPHETDLDGGPGRCRSAPAGGKRRMVGMDDWASEHVARWTEHRIKLPVGPLFLHPLPDRHAGADGQQKNSCARWLPPTRCAGWRKRRRSTTPFTPTLSVICRSGQEVAAGRASGRMTVGIFIGPRNFRVFGGPVAAGFGFRGLVRSIACCLWVMRRAARCWLWRSVRCPSQRG